MILAAAYSAGIFVATAAMQASPSAAERSVEAAMAAQTAESGVAGETAAAVTTRLVVAIEAAVTSAGSAPAQPAGVPYAAAEMPVVGMLPAECIAEAARVGLAAVPVTDLGVGTCGDPVLLAPVAPLCAVEQSGLALVLQAAVAPGVPCLVWSGVVMTAVWAASH